MIFKKYKDHIFRIVLIEENIVFFQTDSIFQSVEGIAVTKNNQTLKKSYPQTGYDDNISYHKVAENIYLYSAGL